MDDADLLRLYVHDRSQDAFASLVHRYVHLVYASALRQTGDSHQADDVTQVVFIDLARNAHTIRRDAVLSAWLVTAVRYRVSKDRRSQARRREHERKAARMPRSTDSQHNDWRQIAAELDQAVAQLPARNRDALLVRYFEGKTMAEVAQRLGISEDAAKQRVSRAIGQLRKLFARRGTAVSTTALASFLSSNLMQPAPAHVVAAALSTAASASAPASLIGAWAFKGTIAMALAKTKITVVAILAAMLIVGGITSVLVYEFRSSPRSDAVILTPVGTGGPSGVVVNAAGKPVEGAEVLLATSQNRIFVYDAPTPQTPLLRTDNSGRFAFGAVGQWSDLIVRNDEGFAHVRPAKLPAGGRIVIQAWGRIEGTLRAGSRPLAGQEISVSAMCELLPTTNPDLPYRTVDVGDAVWNDAYARTDANGRFVFPRVEPGEVRISRFMPRVFEGGMHQSHRFDVGCIGVQPGQTVRVEIGGTGRPVVGCLVLDRPEERLSLFASLHPMQTRIDSPLRVPTNWSQLGEQQRSEWLEKWSHTPQGRIVRFAPNFPVLVEPDGSFRAEDVPPGLNRLYVSSVTMHPSGGSSATLAEASHDFTVPEIAGGRSEEPLDLGTITVQVRPQAKIGEPAPPLQARNPDGSTIRLSDFRGKYVLLYFIQPYALQDANSDSFPLSELRIIRDRFASSDRMVMLAVALESQREPLAQYVKRNGINWPIGLVENWEKTLAPQYVNFPDWAYFIDPEGKVLGISPSSRATYTGLETTTLGQMRYR